MLNDHSFNVHSNTSEKIPSPLVSIIVITYNSSKFIIETLESAKAQDYESLELIISDDGSKDDTVEICEKWIAENSSYFVKVQLLIVAKNGGVSSNCNRGVLASKGIWIKLIAGDDILSRDCVRSYVDFIGKHPVDVCFSHISYFRDDKVYYTTEGDTTLKRFFKKSSSKQLKSYLRYPIFLNVPSIFFSREVFESIKGFDERFTLLEDQPYIFRVLQGQYSIAFLDKNTVKYRQHSNNITAKNNIGLIENLKLAYQIYRKPNLDRFNIIDLICCKYAELDYHLRLNRQTESFYYKFINKSAFFIKKAIW